MEVQREGFVRDTVKTALIFFTPLLVVTGSVLWGFYFLESQKEVSTVKLNQSHALQIQSSNITDHFNLIIADLLFFSRYSKMMDLLEHPDAEESSIAGDFSLFSRGSKLFDQIRIIDKDGYETVRINYSPGAAPAVVTGEALQSKRKRYYFETIYNLQQGEVYISPLDLNVEHGRIETPYKPTIRFGTPLFDNRGRKQGILVFNYLAETIFNEIETLSDIVPGMYMLLNIEGYWLMNENSPSLEWGFMKDDGEQQSMKKLHPEYWQRMRSQRSGQFPVDDGIYTFVTIDPFGGEAPSPAGYSRVYQEPGAEYVWKLVSYLPGKVLYENATRNFWRYILFNILALLILAFLSWRLAVSKTRERDSWQQLQLSRANLEQMVTSRTRELERANTILQSLVESTVGHFGQDYFDTLVKNLCSILGCSSAYIGRIDGDASLTPLAMLIDGQRMDSTASCLPKTHHQDSEGFLHYPEGVTSVFPEARWLAELGASGYVSVPIVNHRGEVIGVIYATSRERLELPVNAKATLSILAARSAAELERIDQERERRELTLQLQQAQKMEALGTLAGGISHDFNNILSSIIGYTDLALEEASAGSFIEKSLREVLAAGNRARELVKQILAFARKSNEELKPIDPKEIVTEVLSLIRSSLPATIEVRQSLESTFSIMANETQMHQILMNLCTNSAHAMEEDGGVLEVRLRDIDRLRSSEISLTRLSPGKYVELTVTDSGGGIPDVIAEKIFEPYFTTKETAKGTGMGLAVVKGIVESYGGRIDFRSSPSKGTTFTIVLPAISAGESRRDPPHGPLPLGNEHILLVDDENPLVRLGRQMLEKSGYQVTSTTSSTEALEIFTATPDVFDLVITDLTMPTLKGDRLAARLRQVSPEIPVILSSGYGSAPGETEKLRVIPDAFLYKPFTQKELAETVRRVLDSRRKKQ